MYGGIAGCKLVFAGFQNVFACHEVFGVAGGGMPVAGLNKGRRCIKKRVAEVTFSRPPAVDVKQLRLPARLRCWRRLPYRFAVQCAQHAADKVLLIYPGW